MRDEETRIRLLYFNENECVNLFIKKQLKKDDNDTNLEHRREKNYHNLQNKKNSDRLSNK